MNIIEKYCIYCQSIVSSDSSYCNHCGKYIGNDEKILQIEKFKKINFKELPMYFLFVFPFVFFLNIFGINKDNIISLVTIFIDIILALWIINTFKKNPIKIELILGRKQNIILETLFFTALIILINYSFVFLLQFDKILKLENTKDFNLTFFISSVIFAPVIEELIFRGILLQKYVIKGKIKYGIFITSLIFGIIHFDFNIPGRIIIGIILSILYLKTGSLYSTMFAHLINNLVIFLLIYSNTIKSIIKYLDSSKLLILLLSGILILIVTIILFFKRNNIEIPIIQNYKGSVKDGV